MEQKQYNQKSFITLSSENEKYIKDHYPELGSGFYGTVYHDKNQNRVIKFTYHFLKPNIVLKHMNFLGEHQVVLPQQKLIDEAGNIIGYTMKFINGYTLMEIGELHATKKITEHDLSKFFQACKKAKKDVLAISRKGIVMEDLARRNMMYDQEEEKIYFIDTDLYYKQPSRIYATIKNISNFKNSMNLVKNKIYKKQNII